MCERITLAERGEQRRSSALSSIYTSGLTALAGNFRD